MAAKKKPTAKKASTKVSDKQLKLKLKTLEKKLKISNPGHTMFLEGEIVDRNQVLKENARIEEEGGEGATFEQLLLGITKASLLTESWLSAASFQETTKVLTEASISGKVDKLRGLKENVIMGRLVPAGTGIAQYQSVKAHIAEQDSAQVADVEVTETESESEENSEQAIA